MIGVNAQVARQVNGLEGWVEGRLDMGVNGWDELVCGKICGMYGLEEGRKEEGKKEVWRKSEKEGMEGEDSWINFKWKQHKYMTLVPINQIPIQ